MNRNAAGKGSTTKSRPQANETTNDLKIDKGKEKQTSSKLAINIFTYCIERAKNLLKLHSAAHGKRSKPEKYMSDAHRAAIVLSVSALDAFIRTFIIDRIREILANQDTDIPGPLKDRIRNLLKEDDLIEAARRSDLLERVEKAFTSDFERKSFQGTKVITEYMRMVGLKDIFHTVARRAGQNEEELCQKLDKYTMRRHSIAHRGDYDLSINPPIENIVSKRDANECIRTVEVIATTIYKVGAQK